MAIVERDVINQGVDENGNTSIDFPLARLGWMETTAEIKAAPGENDYIPIVDVDDQEKMKKTPLPALASGGGAAHYDETMSYAAGDYCVKDGKLYRCTSAMPDGGAWDAACWTETSIAEELKGAVQAATGGAEQQYSETVPYAAGDYCTRDGKLYRCTTAVAAGTAWDAACWTETCIAKELRAVQTVAGEAVPASRKVNGKALSGDISLAAADVGAAASHTHTAAQVGAAAANHTHSFGNAKTAFGAYAGNGAYGSSSPNVLTFNFVPRILVITRANAELHPGSHLRGNETGGSFSDNSIILLAGQGSAHVISVNFGGYAYGILYYSLGTTCSFYSVKDPSISGAMNAGTQYNASGQTYYYFAIG